MTSQQYNFTADNDENLSVSHDLDPSSMTARPINDLSSRMAISCIESNRGAVGGGGWRDQPISHSNSNSSLNSTINGDCLVRKFPRRIIKYVAACLQCRCSSLNWKDLVELHEWDYNKTYLFENKDHQEGIFYSLLREPEFQEYSLNQLKQDLISMPRIDILNDMNRMIDEHNASAGNCTHRNT